MGDNGIADGRVCSVNVAGESSRGVLERGERRRLHSSSLSLSSSTLQHCFVAFLVCFAGGEHEKVAGRHSGSSCGCNGDGGSEGGGCEGRCGWWWW